MGTYYLAYCAEKNEYIHPHELNQGAKLYECASGGPFTAALIALLLEPYPYDNDSVHGRWAGCGVVIANDSPSDGTYDYAEEHATDISDLVAKWLADEQACDLQRPNAVTHPPCEKCDLEVPDWFFELPSDEDSIVLDRAAYLAKDENRWWTWKNRCACARCWHCGALSDAAPRYPCREHPVPRPLDSAPPPPENPPS